MKGDGREYGVLVTRFKRSFGLTYQFKFKADPEWTTINIPFDEMFMSLHGRRPSFYPKVKGDKITRVGFIIADCNDTEPFQLKIDSIQGYKINRQ